MYLPEGLKLNVERAGDFDIQNMFYNEWTHLRLGESTTLCGYTRRTERSFLFVTAFHIGSQDESSVRLTMNL